MKNEGSLIKLIDDYIKFRVDRVDAGLMDKIEEDDPESDPKFWEKLTKEEKEKRTTAKEKRKEEEKKRKDEEEKKQKDLIANATQ